MNGPLKNVRVEVSDRCSGEEDRAAGFALLDESLERLGGKKTVLGVPCGISSLQQFREDFLNRCTAGPDNDLRQQLAGYYMKSFKALSRSRKRFSLFLEKFLPFGDTEFTGRINTAQHAVPGRGNLLSQLPGICRFLTGFKQCW